MDKANFTGLRRFNSYIRENLRRWQIPQCGAGWFVQDIILI